MCDCHILEDNSFRILAVACEEIIKAKCVTRQVGMRFDCVNQIVDHVRSKWHRGVLISGLPCVHLKMIREASHGTDAPNFIAIPDGLAFDVHFCTKCAEIWHRGLINWQVLVKNIKL